MSAGFDTNLIYSSLIPLTFSNIWYNCSSKHLIVFIFSFKDNFSLILFIVLVICPIYADRLLRKVKIFSEIKCSSSR